MAIVLYSYYLRDPAAREELERVPLKHVAPRARGEETVERWTLHRSIDLPGGAADGPDYVSVVEVADMKRWAAGGQRGRAGSERRAVAGTAAR
jgi:hypothetical protein